MLNDLKELIAVRSVMGEAQPSAPFGDGPKQALDTFLAIAQKYGLKTHDENGYCGWAEWGEGEQIIGILGHLDVVPAGDGWSHDPYSLVCENGLLYGRGVADDKGPTVAALHAIKRLKESGYTPRHRIRLIVGCNEENGSQCIEYYRNHCEIPVASFVPDADFPIINSEKGILHLSLSFLSDAVLTENVTSVTAGVRPNIVPDSCSAQIPKGCPLYNTVARLANNGNPFLQPQAAKIIVDAGFRPQDYTAHFFENELLLESRGVAGHAMAPEKGENAAAKMLVLLNGLLEEKSPTLAVCARRLHAPNPATNLGIQQQDDVSGALTVNLGMLSYSSKSGKLCATLDCRLPVCANHIAVVREIEKNLAGSTAHILRWSPNLYIPESDKLVQALLDAYTQTTGNERKCLYCGGGTYARELPNAVAFGPTFEGLETNIHNIDESFPVELFDKLPAIYEAAIRKLDQAF